MTNTPNELLNTPPSADPAYFDQWGTMINTNMGLIDTALGGVLALSVTGGTTVLTSVTAAADQARNAHFNFSGVLASDQTVLWPASCGRMFSVTNSCTGAFNLILGANNGSSAPAGTTVTVPQGATLLCYSDGTNVKVRQLGFVGNSTVSGNLSVSGTLNVTGTATFADGGVWSASGISGLLGLTLGVGGTGNAQLYQIINGTSGGVSSNFGLKLQANGSTVAQFYYDVPTGSTRISSGSLDPAILIFANTGLLRFSGYGAGTLTTDASGNVTASSDATLKDIVGPFTRGTADIIKIETCKWKWNAASKLNGETEQASYTAQAVQVGVPEAVSIGPDGKLTLFDGAIIATLINSIKELNARIATLEAKP